MEVAIRKWFNEIICILFDESANLGVNLESIGHAGALKDNQKETDVLSKL